MSATVVLAALVVTAASAASKSADPHTASASYSSVIVHKDEPSAATARRTPSQGPGQPDGWSFSQVHISFPSTGATRSAKKLPEAPVSSPTPEGASTRVTSQSTAKQTTSEVPSGDDIDKLSVVDDRDENEVEVDNVGESSSPHVSESRQDLGASSVNLGYSIGVAGASRSNTVPANDPNPQKGAATNAQSYSVSNLHIGHNNGPSRTTPPIPRSNILGDIITGRPPGVYEQRVPANDALGQIDQKYHSSNGNIFANNVQCQQYYHSNGARLCEPKSTQLGARINVNQPQDVNGFNSAQFRNDVSSGHSRAQSTQRTPNNHNAHNNKLHGHGDLTSSSAHPQGKVVPENSAEIVNSFPARTQQPQNIANVHNLRNGHSDVVGSTNQIHNSIPGKALSQAFGGNGNNAQTSTHRTQQIQNNVQSHNPSNVRYNQLTSGSNLVQAVSPFKTLSHNSVNMAGNIQTIGQSTVQALSSNNVQIQGVASSYREANNNHRAQHQVPINVLSQHVAESKTPRVNAINNFNTNNFQSDRPADRNRNNQETKNDQLNIQLRGSTSQHNENCHKQQTKSTVNSLENSINNGNIENATNSNGGTSYIYFNALKNSRNPDSFISATNNQQSVSLQSNPITFGVVNLPLTNLGYGIDTSFGNTAQIKDQISVITVGNSGENMLQFNNVQSNLSHIHGASPNGSPQHQAIIYYGSDMQNNNIPHHTTTKDKGFDHASALGNSNMFGHKDALVSQTQQRNNIHQTTQNHINQNAASTGNGIAPNAKRQFSSFHNSIYSGFPPKLNTDNSQQISFGNGHTASSQVANNNNRVPLSDKAVLGGNPTVLKIPGQSILNQASLSDFRLSEIQPNPILLNTGLLSYQKLREGQSLNFPFQNVNVASLPSTLFAISGTPGLANSNNSLLTADNSQFFTSNTIPLSIHSSQIPSPVNHNAGDVNLGGHALHHSPTNTQQFVVNNNLQNLVHNPQFVNSGNPISHVHNANSVNLHFKTHHNLASLPTQQQNLQLEKGLHQAVPTGQNTKDFIPQIQINSDTQLPNFQYVPHSLHVIQSENHGNQNIVSGIQNPFSGVQQTLPGHALEGQHHIFQAGENLRDENSFPNRQLINADHPILQNINHAADGNHPNANAEPIRQNLVQLSQQFEQNGISYFQSNNQQTAHSSRYSNQEIHAPGQDTSGGSNKVFSGFVPEHRNVATSGNDAPGIQNAQFHQLTSPRILIGDVPKTAGIASNLLQFRRPGGSFLGYQGRSLFNLKSQVKDNASQKISQSLNAGNQSSQLADSELFTIESSRSPQLPSTSVAYSAGVQSNHEATPMNIGIQALPQHGISFHNSNVNLLQSHRDQGRRPSGGLISSGINYIRQESNGFGFGSQPSYVHSDIPGKVLHSVVPNVIYIMNVSREEQTAPQPSSHVQYFSQADALQQNNDAPLAIFFDQHTVQSSSAHGHSTGEEWSHRKPPAGSFQRTELVKPVTEPAQDTAGARAAYTLPATSLLAPGL